MHHRTVMRLLVLVGLAASAVAASAQNMSHTEPYDQLRKALMTGQRVSAIFDFNLCQPSLPLQAGLPIQEFMILHDHIAFSQIHPTLHGQDNQVTDEFMRYTIYPVTTKATTSNTIAGESAKVVMAAYSWKQGESRAKPTRPTPITCYIGKGVKFVW